jgi:hypothetical protein
VAFCWRNCRSKVVPVRPRAGKSSRIHDHRRAERGQSASGMRRAPTPPPKGVVFCPPGPGGPNVLATRAHSPPKYIYCRNRK